MNSACANAARIRQPPESSANGRTESTSLKPKPARMRLALASAAYASRRSSSSPSSPNRLAASCHVASSHWPDPFVSAASIASINLDSSERRASVTWSHETSASKADRAPPSSSCATHATSLTRALMRPEAMSLTSVDLPLPLAPSSATFLPRAILMEASSKSRTPRTETSMPLTSTTASVALVSSSPSPPPRTWTLTASRALAHDSGADSADGPFRFLASFSSGASSGGRRPSFSALASILRSFPVSLAPSFCLIISARS